MACADTHDVDVPPSRTLTFLGCGTLGSAILHGLLASLVADNAPSARPLQHRTSPEEKGQNRESRPDGDQHTLSALEGQGLQTLTHFIACVRTSQSVDRLTKELSKSSYPFPVKVIQGENARAVEAADTILLGCQPQDLNNCIGDPAVAKALRGKLLISILAGVTIPQIEAVLSPPPIPTAPAGPKIKGSPRGSPSAPTTIVRAMPNMAAFVRASTTVVTSTATPRALRLVDWIFATIGSVTHIPASQFDACTALCGSMPAFFALFIEAMLDGAVALGLKRSEALVMAALTMKGTAALVLGGEAPEELREKVATPGGSTIQGLLDLERKALRGTVADALISCADAARGEGRTRRDG